MVLEGLRSAWGSRPFSLLSPLSSLGTKELLELLETVYFPCRFLLLHPAVLRLGFFLRLIICKPLLTRNKFLGCESDAHMEFLRDKGINESEEDGGRPAAGVVLFLPGEGKGQFLAKKS